MLRAYSTPGLETGQWGLAAELRTAHHLGMGLRHLRTLAPLLLLAVVVTIGPARAEEPAGFHADVAAYAAQLIEAGTDAEAIQKVVAAHPTQDPWRVAEHLLHTGHRAVATALAAAQPAYGKAHLTAYLDSPRPGADTDKAALAEVLRAYDAQDITRVIELAAAVPSEPPSVTRGEILYIAGRAVMGTPDVSGAVERFLASARMAEALHWGEGAVRGYDAAATALYRARQLMPAREHWLAMRDRAAQLERPHVLALAEAKYSRILLRTGAPKDAIKRARAALEIYEHVGDAAGVAITCHLLGQIYYGTSAFNRARQMVERAVRGWATLGDLEREGRGLQTLAGVQIKLGRYRAALRSLDRSGQIAEQRGDKLLLLATNINRAAAYDYLGNWAQSVALNNQIAEAAREMQDRARLAFALLNMGTGYHRMRQLEPARTALTEAIELLRGLGQQRALLVANLILLTVRQALGDTEGLEPALDESQKLAESTGDRESLAGIARLRGDLLLDAGKPADAEPHFTQAVRLYRRVRLGRELVSALRALANAQHAQGRHDAALETARSALGPMEKLLARLSDSQGAQSRAQFASLYRIGFDAALAADAPEDAVFFLETSRAGALMELLGNATALRTVAVPEMLQRAEAAAREREGTALRAFQAAAGSGKRSAIRSTGREFDEAHAEVRAIRQEIQAAAKEAANTAYPRAASLDEIQGWLEDGDALVLYAVHPELAHAAVVTADDVRLVALGASEAIREAAQGLRPADPDAEHVAEAKRLAELVWKPLALPASIRRVFVSPDGALTTVPLRLIEPERALTFLPSATALGILREQAGRQATGVLAVGAPIYPDVPVRVAGGSARLTQLPGTKVEAQAIGTKALLGPEATVTGFLTAVGEQPRWRSVHFACHGLLDDKHPSDSALALTPDTAYPQGLLPAQLVFQTRIRADIIGLSACDTGRGRLASGEGMLGLTRSFMAAGAPRVLSSLWQVDDAATQALMLEFYRHFAPKDPETKPRSAAESLRLAQAHVRSQAQWAHPFYWAAWVIWGLH